MPADPSTVLDRVAWCGRAARLALEDPVEGLDRVLVRLVRQRRPRSAPTAEPTDTFPAHLHALLRAPWPCPACDRFEQTFAAAIARLEAKSYPVGRGAFGGWDDADPGFARAIWSIAMHLRPRVVVETGVARGVTTHVILEALRQQGLGHLWSVDRPPLDPQLHSQVGAAVPHELRSGWTLLRGTSRRVLPALLRQVGSVDVFVHDSLHTERNVRFELASAWSSMDGAGAVVVDDVERNGAFAEFVAAEPVAAVVAAADDGRSCFGVAVAPPR
jgi:predicted O-methyltransferase YrrM